MEVDHKQVRVILRPVADIPKDVKQENALLDWACSSYQSAMLIVAGGVLAKTRSLDTAASVLWWCVNLQCCQDARRSTHAATR